MRRVQYFTHKRSKNCGQVWDSVLFLSGWRRARRFESWDPFSFLPAFSICVLLPELKAGKLEGERRREKFFFGKERELLSLMRLASWRDKGPFFSPGAKSTGLVVLQFSPCCQASGKEWSDERKFTLICVKFKMDRKSKWPSGDKPLHPFVHLNFFSTEQDWPN